MQGKKYITVQGKTTYIAIDSLVNSAIVVLSPYLGGNMRIIILETTIKDAPSVAIGVLVVGSHKSSCYFHQSNDSQH